MKIKFNTKPAYWNKAIKHLKENDPILKTIIEQTKSNIFLTRNCTPFQTLVNAIVGQQISVKAASSISNKLKNKLKHINHSRIDRSSIKTLKDCGLSRQKATYLKEISKKFISNPSFFYSFKHLDDKSIIEKLCTLKGIGEWTAQMYLIFQLNRPDVLPLGDLGFIKSTNKLYKLSEKNNFDEIINIAKKWIPYRSVAVWQIWRIIDNDIIQY